MPPLVHRGMFLWLAALAITSSIIGAATADAHALLVSSNPKGGAEVGATPGTVVLRFDEPLSTKLSRALVTVPSGRKYSGTVSGQVMRVPLATNLPGVYRVDYTTVSSLDGHTIRGSYHFGVATRPGPAAAGGTSTAPSGSDLLVSAGRVFEYGALLLACGIALLRLLGRHLKGLHLPAVSTAAVLLGAGIAVVVGEAIVATSSVAPSSLASYLTNGFTGWARVVRVCLEAGVLITALRGRGLSPALLAAVIAALAAGGHAADVEPAIGGIAVDAAHLAAAGLWAGGILALGWLRLSRGWDQNGTLLLTRFALVAPWAFLLSVGLGVVQAYQEVGSTKMLLGSSYGLTLMVKAAVIAAMLPLSLFAWRRGRAMLRLESALALLVVVAAAALAAYPLPPREAGEEAAAANVAPGASAFPDQGDLTLGGKAGRTLVGVSLHPASPGRNQVRIYLGAPNGGGEARRSRVGLRVSGSVRRTQRCGASCRTAEVHLGDSPARVGVIVGGKDGGEASFSLPALPAPDGLALARSASTRMEKLKSYRVQENLSGIRSLYSYDRPHRIWVRVMYTGGSQETLWMGRRTWEREGPHESWKFRSKGGNPAPVPYFVWDSFKPFVDARVVGHGRVGGTPATLVSFFGGHGSDPEPVWFTQWISRRGIVLRSEMFAPNHFMIDRYVALNRHFALRRLPL